MPFGDPTRWLIHKRHGRWHVRPPVGHFWGRHSEHPSGAAAHEAFRTQQG